MVLPTLLLGATVMPTKGAGDPNKLHDAVAISFPRSIMDRPRIVPYTRDSCAGVEVAIFIQKNQIARNRKDRCRGASTRPHKFTVIDVGESQLHLAKRAKRSSHPSKIGPQKVGSTFRPEATTSGPCREARPLGRTMPRAPGPFRQVELTFPSVQCWRDWCTHAMHSTVED
jgi:hypothetical protein